MTAKQLRNSILQMAVQGKLVPQNPDDEPASVLLEKIRKEKQRLVKEGKIKKDKNESVIFRGSDKIPGTEAGSFYEKTGNGKPVDITDELPFEIPESWEWVRLGCIVKMQAGKSISTSKIYQEYKNQLYPCYGANGIRGYVDKYNCDGNFPIIGRQGTAGSINYAIGKFYATEHAVVVYPFIDLNTKWLKYFLDALNLNKYATATAQPGLAVSKITQVFIPLPPFDEQIKIVQKIEELTPLIANYQVAENKISKLNTEFPSAFKKSILQSAIQGKLVPQDPNDEPASVLLQKIRGEKEKLIKAGKIKKPKTESFIFRRDGSWRERTGKTEKCIDDEIPFEIPDSWEWARLANIINELSTGPFGSILHKSDYVKDGIPVINPTNIIDGKIDLNTTSSISEEKFKELLSYKLDKNDIIIARRGEIGRCAIFENDEQDAICGTGCFILRNNRFIYSKYLVSFFHSPFCINYLSSVSIGTTMANLNHSLLENILIPLPPFQEQKRIADKVAQFMEMEESFTRALGQ